MEVILFKDIKKALSNKETFWLNLSILLYIALLPFNAFGLKIIPAASFQLKPTKIVLLFVLLFCFRALMRKEIKIKAERSLYFFLALQILANFVSIIHSPNKRESLILAAAISQYSVLVFILINVLHERPLLKSALKIMGCVIIVISGYYLIMYIFRGGVFHTRLEFSLLGNNIAHYLSYAMLMFGTGLLYLFFDEKARWFRIFLFISAVLWLFVTIIPAVKIFQIAMLLFLSVLAIMLKEKRREVSLFIVLYCIFFVIQFNIVTIKNKFSMLKYSAKTQFAASSGTPLAKPAESTAVRPSGLSSPKPAESSVAKPLEAPVFKSAGPSVAKPEEPSVFKSAGPSVPNPEEPLIPKPFLLADSSDENKIKNRWGNVEIADSSALRIRGIVAGFFMGCVHPWTGVGVGQTRYFFDKFSNLVREKSKDASFLPNSPFKKNIFTDKVWTKENASIFNIFMNAWAETGIFGLIAIIGILLSTLLKGLRAIPASRQSEEPLSFLLPLFIALILVHQTVYFWAHPWLWTVIGLTYASANTVALKHAKEEVRSED